MAPINPGDVARKTRESQARRLLGGFAPAVEDVERIFHHFDTQSTVTTSQTAALLTLAVVLTIQPEEDL